MPSRQEIQRKAARHQRVLRAWTKIESMSNIACDEMLGADGDLDDDSVNRYEHVADLLETLATELDAIRATTA